MSTTTTDLDFRVDDRVYIDPASATKPQWQGTWIVDKVNEKSVHMHRPEGVERGPLTTMRAAKSLLFKGEWPETASPRFDILDNEWFDNGAVVRLRGKGDTLYVVTGTSGNGYRVFELGGSSRYFRNVSARQMERVLFIDGWVKGEVSE